jgi:hypothetical protein
MEYSELIIEREIVEDQIKIVKEQIKYYEGFGFTLSRFKLDDLYERLETLEENRKELYQNT